MPDSCFGLLKQKTRRTHIECLDDILCAVDKSACVNHTCLVGTQDGEVLVPTYDWVSYFATYFKKIPQIKSYHSFKIDVDAPGKITCKEYSNSVSTTFDIIKVPGVLPTTGELPPIIAPSGLSDDRQWYLYDKIQPFCSERSRDLTCPLPTVPRSSRRCTPCLTPATSPTRAIVTETSPPKKRSRVCGHCGVSGHNRRSCTQLRQ